MPADYELPGLTDSKKISPKKREQLAERIKDIALSWSVARASVADIDRLNILHASMLAMERAVDALTIRPHHVLVDGNRCPAWNYSSEAIVGGDALVAEISAASILAKVCRDREMLDMAEQYPGYGFEKHKGYPTREHLLAIERLGVTPEHRRSFGPVRAVIAQSRLDID